MNMLQTVKQTCKMLNFVSVCFFLHISVKLICSTSAFVYCLWWRFESRQTGTIASQLYFTQSLPLNGVRSSSQIHALNVCMQWLIHSVQAPSWCFCVGHIDLRRSTGRFLHRPPLELCCHMRMMFKGCEEGIILCTALP